MVKELTFAVKESMKESSLPNLAALPERGRGERILSTVKVFKSILSPEKPVKSSLARH